MSKLGMPDVVIAFKEKGIEAIGRSQRGIVCLVLEEKGKDLTKDYLTIYTVDDIPTTLTEANQQQIKLALLGYQTAPKKVIVYFIPPVDDTTTAGGEVEDLGEEIEDLDSPVDEEFSVRRPGLLTLAAEVTPKQDYTQVLKVLEGVKFTYLVIPNIRPTQVSDIASWVKSMRTVRRVMVKAVLPNCAADNEGVINFTNSLIRDTDGNTYTAAEYCSRVAGILAGTPMTISATYAPVSELIEVEAETKEERDERVARGEFFFFSDLQKVKVARAVNSFVTTYQGKGDDFKFCKIVEILDMIHDDIKETCHDNYIGKYANSADNRALVCVAVNGYLHTLETEGLLEIGENTCYIDLTAVKNWREANGLNTREELEAMDEGTLKKLNLHENVFLAADLSVLNAIENITINCSID